MALERIEIGPKVEAKRKHNAELPEQKPGEHLWVVVGAWTVRPNAERYFLDMENLMSLDGPGCFWCEEQWSEELASKPCRGHGE
jgi:hypothetical protein